MASEDVLHKTLKNADGKPFQKYKGIQNNFVLEDYELIFDDIQNDRMGHTAVRVRVPIKKAGFPEDMYNTKSREIALRDLIARRFRESARTHARSPIPKTSGGEIFIPRPGQEILERWSVVITQYFIEVRFTVDLPSDGNKVSAMAMELLLERIKTVVSESMYSSQYKQSKVYNHLFTNENADYIRENLDSRGLIAFIADGAVIPRRDDDLAPMIDAAPFESDPSMRVTFEVPNGEPVFGMGIPKGFTVITGKSRSGKSSILDGIYAGVYNHIPGDGREYVITSNKAAYVMSEPNRPADSVDISMFVSSSDEFEDVSAAKKEFISSPMSEFVSVSEAIEMGSDLLLIDEEYSNPCVIRKGFLSDEDRVTSLSELGRSMGKNGTSLIMVSGDESAVRSADNILIVEAFKAKPSDVERIEASSEFIVPAKRSPVSKGIVYEKGHRDVNIVSKSIRSIEIGEFIVNIPVAALFDISQTSTIADAAIMMKDLMDGSADMLETCEKAISMLKEQDDSVDNGIGMHHVTIRAIDLAALMNRHPQMLAIQKR